MGKERVSVSPCRKDQLIEMREHTSISMGKDLISLSLGRRHYLTETRRRTSISMVQNQYSMSSFNGGSIESQADTAASQWSGTGF